MNDIPSKPRENTRRDAPSQRTLWLGVMVYTIVALLPAIIGVWIDPYVSSQSWQSLGVSVSGHLVFAIVCLQFVLISKPSWIENSFGAAPPLRLHRTMAIGATLLALVHLGIMVGSRGQWNLILYPMVSWPIQLGRLAVVCFVTILVISLGRRFIPINNPDWLWFHSVLAWLILLSGFVHGLALGSSFDHPIFALIWIGYFVMAIAAWVLKKYSLREA